MYAGQDIMRFKTFAPALLVAAGALATPVNAANTWPPRNYDPGLIVEWNALLVDALPPSVGVEVPRYYALMHTAMADAVSSIEGSSRPLQVRVPAARHASSDAAAEQAAHDVLVVLLPAHKDEFDAALSKRLATIHRVRANLGVQVGREVARRV